jgi:hypothetical protein
MPQIPVEYPNIAGALGSIVPGPASLAIRRGRLSPFLSIPMAAWQTLAKFGIAGRKVTRLVIAKILLYNLTS